MPGTQCKWRGYKSSGQTIKGFSQAATDNRKSSRGPEQGSDMDSIILLAGRLRTKEQSWGNQLKKLDLNNMWQGNGEGETDEEVISEAESTEFDNCSDAGDRETEEKKIIDFKSLNV